MGGCFCLCWVLFGCFRLYKKIRRASTTTDLYFFLGLNLVCLCFRFKSNLFTYCCSWLFLFVLMAYMYLIGFLRLLLVVSRLFYNKWGAMRNVSLQSAALHLPRREWLDWLHHHGSASHHSPQDHTGNPVKSVSWAPPQRASFIRSRSCPGTCRCFWGPQN